MFHGLYVVTPDLLDTSELLQKVALTLSQGARILQYRNKQASSRLAYTQAQALRELTQRFGVTFIVNDDLWLAQQVHAEGVHLGYEDGDWFSARTQLPPNMLLGVSCYNDPILVQKAIKASVDYIALGTLFPSKTKPFAPDTGDRCTTVYSGSNQGARKAETRVYIPAHEDFAYRATQHWPARGGCATVSTGVSFMRQIRPYTSIPIVAIGGITLSNASQVIQAGADSIAVISALFDAPDIAETTRKFCNLFPRSL